MFKLIQVKNLYFIFLLFSFSFHSQNNIKENQNTEGFNEKIIFHLSKTFTFKNVDSVKHHAYHALHYANLSNNDTLLMESYHAMAHASKIKYNYSLTEENAIKCLDLAVKLDDNYFQFLCNNQLGIVKSSEKQYQLSIVYYTNALSLAKKDNDTVNVSLLYHNIALNYYIIEKPYLAKLFMKKSEEAYKSIKVFKDPYRKDSDFIYLYMKKSLVADTKEEALLYVDKAIERAIDNEFNFHTALSYKYKGRVYSQYENYDLAIVNFKKAIVYEKKVNTKSADSRIELMNALVNAGKYDMAKQYKDTLLKSFSYNDIRPLYLDKNKVFSEIHRNLGDFNMALFYANKRATISDSLLKYNNHNLFAEFGKRFETREKENEITNQQLVIEKQDNEKKNIILYGGLALFAGLLIFQWRFNTQKNSKKEAEDAYEKERDFNQMRTAFLENISHEIRTPLTLINGYLNLINEEVEKPKIKDYVNSALINSKKVIFDADEILNLLKFEDHKMLKKIVTKPLNEFLKIIFLSFEVVTNPRNLELVYESQIPNNFIIKIDAEKVEKILTNLISNAIKFSDSNSKIIFQVAIKNDYLEVKVTDLGQGIDEEDQKRIFTRFYQSKNNKSIGGIGIGLLLAKDFAQFLGGDIKVKSKINEGSTFTFIMPIAETIAVEKSEETGSIDITNDQSEELKIKNNKSIQNKPSILIVEDNIEMSNYLKEILTPYYNCTFAFNGFEGLDFAKNKKFDLVASDIMMPKLDGYQFMEKLKLISEYAKVPFILVTAKTLAEDKMKGFSIGIDDYITKPFTKEELIVRIDNLLKNSANLRLYLTGSDQFNENIQETHVDKLLNDIEKVVMDNISNENFKVENLASKMNYSQRQLSRILNRYAGLSTIKFILEIKLREAYKLIKSEKFGTISEVQYEVGITSPSYFSEKFKSRFGINPSELMRKQNV